MTVAGCGIVTNAIQCDGFHGKNIVQGACRVPRSSHLRGTLVGLGNDLIGRSNCLMKGPKEFFYGSDGRSRTENILHRRAGK